MGTITTMILVRKNTISDELLQTADYREDTKQTENNS